MSSAPTDGTVVLVCSGNEENWYVVPAMYCRYRGQEPTWWGVAPTGLSRERDPKTGEYRLVTWEDYPERLPVGWMGLAMTPFCWMPLPAPEAADTLRRRSAQILSRKYGERSA